MKTLATILSILAATPLVIAQDRTALLIANSDYGEHRLSHVPQDADAVSAALRDAGFLVTRKDNVEAKELKNVIQEFALQTRTNGVALIYYAGLAGQYQTYSSKGAWWNYLQGSGKPDGRLDSLSLAELAKILQDHSTARLHYVVLDAADVNPFQKEDHPAGLAVVDAEELDDDVLVWLADQPNTPVDPSRDSVAQSSDKPSVFASVLSQNLSRASQSVGKMLDAVQAEVADLTGGNQRPWFCAGGDELTRSSWTSNRRWVETDSPREGRQAGEQWVNGLGMVFCWCPPGKFTMGLPQANTRWTKDAGQVEVTLTRGFWCGKYEFTQREYYRLRRRGPDRESLLEHRNAPMTHMKFGDAMNVCKLLNDMERSAGRLPDGWEYSLPTEAEWEYACRSGSAACYSFGDALSELPRFANFADQSLHAADDAFHYASTAFDDGVGDRPEIVGSYAPNAWGLHDMHGNVSEWCLDVYAPELPGGIDPMSSAEPKEHSTRVTRGGAWCSTPEYCQAGFRNSLSPHPNATKYPFVGVRLVLKRMPQ